MPISQSISLDLQLTVGGLAVDLQNWSQNRRGPGPDYKLFQFFSGKGQTSVDGRWHTHRQNEVVLIPAHRAITHRSRGKISLGWIHFRPLSPHLEALLSHIDHAVSISHENDDILPWESVRNHLRTGQGLSLLMMQASVAQWCLRGLHSAFGDNGPVVDLDPRLAAVHRHIERHYLERPSLADLAALVDWSPSHLQKRFRAAYGHSPHLAVQRYIMGDVLDALRTTPCSLASIADNLGFSDRFHLSKAIKAYFGESARDLR